MEPMELQAVSDFVLACILVFLGFGWLLIGSATALGGAKRWGWGAYGGYFGGLFWPFIWLYVAVKALDEFLSCEDDEKALRDALAAAEAKLAHIDDPHKGAVHVNAKYVEELEAKAALADDMYRIKDDEGTDYNPRVLAWLARYTALSEKEMP